MKNTELNAKENKGGTMNIKENKEVGEKTVIRNNTYKSEYRNHSFLESMRNIINWRGFINSPYTVMTYVTVFIVSLIMRLINIDITDSGAPIFDEKHYVPQAEQISNLGIENNPSYGLVVHPFLGKKLISFGIEMFGYNPMGWRITSVIAGSLVALLVFATAHRITKSMSMAILAAILINTEGISFSMSRLTLKMEFGSKKNIISK